MMRLQIKKCLRSNFSSVVNSEISPPFLNFIGNPLVLGWVNLIQPIGDTSNGRQIEFKSLIVGNYIDAPHKTRDDNRIKLHQTSDQFTTNLFPMEIAGSATNDADELTLTKIEVSHVKQNQGAPEQKVSVLG